MHWNRTGYARLFRVDNVIAIIAKIHVAAILGLEFIEVILGPAKDLKYYRCELFEGCLVCDLKVPIPKSSSPSTRFETPRFNMTLLTI